MHRLLRKIVVPVVAFGLIGAACGESAKTSDDASPAPTRTAAAKLDLATGAPSLVQTLTDLLDSHVYMASIAVVTGLTNGLDSPAFAASAEALDTNSQDLAAAIESVYGADAGAQFLKLWRAHIGFFVQYTEGKATKDDAKAEEALTKLQNYKEDFAAFLESATGGKLPADAAAEALQMHVDSLIEAIDAAVAGDPSVFAKVYTAASHHMPQTASALAGAIVAQFPEKFAN
ncbi:MAG: hypothetical protein LC722_02935 [Actinobacteria bacterium]|nr:hypothetical protein [Actinomycetota bacterium]